MPKILITVFDMEIGGIERSLINMLESFDYENYEVDLFICQHAGDFLSFIPEQVHVLPEQAQYTVFRKSMLSCLKEGHFSAFLIRLASKMLAGWKAKRRKLKEGSGYIQMQLVLKFTSYVLPKIDQEYDLAISYAWPHDIVANNVKAAKKMAWIHTDYSELEIDNEIDLALWNKFDTIASISDACTEAFLKTYPSLQSKIMLIENITSPRFIKQMAEEPLQINEGQEETFSIVSVGRLSYVKGFDMAVQALRLLHDKGLTAIKWYIVGYGGYENQLKSIIAENKLENHFILVGKQMNPYPYMKHCDLYVQPSRYEGKAVTVTEAKILGKPVMITNYPTAGSQIEDGEEGLICELSVEGIAEGIERLYKDVVLRDSLASHCARTDYSNTDELNKIYHTVGHSEPNFVRKEVTV
ncbi:glycosyl transferase [Paenibacillus marchantiophytorum]|uniref:Glycosyl transferase n=1 Tax=Paenibacillus marchantiophytorum TaxID=1619310 RepID=A0ABQ2BRW2_9BACL|nr:glycosyltransferase [Paenibacillus marchantiophytorum]GGI46082.1 glycosyl transferase [Paenibacillus marchantiophytorum]